MLSFEKILQNNQTRKIVKKKKIKESNTIFLLNKNNFSLILFFWILGIFKNKKGKL